MNSNNQPDDRRSQPKLLVLLLKVAYEVYLTSEGAPRKSFQRFFTEPAHKHDFDNLFKAIAKLPRDNKSEYEQTADILHLVLKVILLQQAKYVSTLKSKKYKKLYRSTNATLTAEQRFYIEVLNHERDKHHFSRLLMCVLKRYEKISEFNLIDFLWKKYKLNREYYDKIEDGYDNYELYKPVREFGVIRGVLIEDDDYERFVNEPEEESLTSFVPITNNKDTTDRLGQLNKYLQDMESLGEKIAEGFDVLPNVPRDKVVNHLMALRNLCKAVDLIEAEALYLEVLSSFAVRIKITEHRRIKVRKNKKTLTEDELHLINLALRLKGCVEDILVVFNRDLPFIINRLQQDESSLRFTLINVLTYKETSIIPDYVEHLMFCYEVEAVRAELNNLSLEQLRKLHVLFNDHRLIQLVEEAAPMKAHLAEQKALNRHRIAGYIDNILIGKSPVRTDENKTAVERYRGKK